MQPGEGIYIHHTWSRYSDGWGSGGRVVRGGSRRACVIFHASYHGKHTFQPSKLRWVNPAFQQRMKPQSYGLVQGRSASHKLLDPTGKHFLDPYDQHGSKYIWDCLGGGQRSGYTRCTANWCSLFSFVSPRFGAALQLRPCPAVPPLWAGKGNTC